MLELPPTMSIHPVFSVASLEPAPKGQDPYGRKRDDGRPTVVDNDVEGTADHYEINLLLDRRERRLRGKGNNSVVEFLVKWKSWSPYWNSWYDIKDLGSDMSRSDDNNHNQVRWRT